MKMILICETTVHTFPNMNYFWMTPCFYLLGFPFIQGRADHALNSLNFITRCVTRYEDDIIVSCPQKHLILEVNAMAGFSRNKSCSFDHNDCLGWSERLAIQKSKCLGQQMCRISVKRTLPIAHSFGSNENCVGKSIDYIAVTSPECVHKDYFFDICSKKSIKKANQGYIVKGVSCKGVNKRSKKLWEFKETVTLNMKLKDISINSQDDLQVRWRTVNGTLVKSSLRGHPIFEARGRDFRLIWKQRRTSPYNGFIISFNVKNITNRAEKIHPIQNDGISNEVLIDEDSSSIQKVKKGGVKRKGKQLRNLKPRSGITQERNVRHSDSSLILKGSLQSRMTWKPKHFSFSCPEGKIIYSPNISIGVGRRLKCKGFTPKIIVQRNECYWKQTCKLQWNGPSFVTMSNNYKCIGRTANVISTSGYQCIEKERVFNICDKTFKTIRKSSGLLRSHSIYPWNYGEKTIKCRKKIKIGNRKLKLHLITVDLDEDADEFQIKHTKRTIFRGNTNNFSTILSGGTVEIVMSISRRTKSGKGFLMHFKKQRKTRERRHHRHRSVN